MSNPAPAFPGSEETTDVDLRTDLEKRLEWLCDDWQDALEIDSYEEWHDVRLSIYGARQALIRGGRHDDLEAYLELGNVAFQHGLDRIADGNYEGSPEMTAAEMYGIPPNEYEIETSLTASLTRLNAMGPLKGLPYRAPKPIVAPAPHAVVEYARTAEQLAETERRAGESIQEFYASCRRRTVAPFFVGD